MSRKEPTLPNDLSSLSHAALQRMLTEERAKREKLETKNQQLIIKCDQLANDRKGLENRPLEHERQRLQWENTVAALTKVNTQQSEMITQKTETIALITETVQALQRKVEQQEHYLALLLRRMHGPRGERFHPDQLTLFDADELVVIAKEQEELVKEEVKDATSPRKGHGRRAIPKHIPRETKRYELSDVERQCPGCGEVRHEIGCETSEQLEYIPAQYKVIVHERVKYACRACQEHVAISAKAPQPVEKGLPGPGLLAHTVLAKYGDHSPLYRQEDVHARHGVLLRRSTLCDWIAAAAVLAEPLYQLMRERVLTSRIIWTDDTTVKLLDALLGRARTARFWAYLGDFPRPYTIFDFTDSRKRDGPQAFLQGFAGYLQADAYGGYDGIFTSGHVIEVACWAHARRKFFEAKTTDPVRAHHALALIQRLYKIEEDARELTCEARQAARQVHSLPLLEAFRAWLDEQTDPVPKSPIGQAIGYAHNQWTALMRYCDDGELSIDNNVSERTMRLPALGRKNWLFVASQAGGQRAAVLFSLVASCKRNQVEPWAYLRDVFTQLPLLRAARERGEDVTAQLDALLPDRWLQTHPQHRWEIDVLRKHSRKQPLRKKRKK